MIKLSYWRPSLQSYILEGRANSFEWGKWDCALFVCGAIEAMTGEDLGKSYRGRYTTAAGGLKLIKKDGYKDHAEFAAAFLEEDPRGPAFAMLGDIVAYKVDGNTGIALGVCNGETSYVLMPEGMGTMLTLNAYRVFRI